MANLVELFDNIVQMQNLNGVPLAAGKLYVYALGRTRLMDTWSDMDGESLNPNPIILDDAGQAHVYVSDDFDYTLVVCDQYNNEIFSLDKYLYSKGSHSHADVAVAPSESIAVSSYHVGETTVYVPYLTGQLGKVYEGIDPIVVNNQVDKISANHVPLGVQDPLYFVQDDEEGCIIGLSGGTVPEGTMNESAFGYQDGQITSYNGSAFSAGNSYEAGSYVDIDNNTISVTGLQPEGDYAYNSALSSKLDVTALPQDLVHSGELTAYYPIDNPSGFITGVDLTDYATTAQLDEKLDKSDSGNFYPMTGNPSGFLTAHQSLQGYATEQWVEGKGYITGVDIPESAVWNATTQTVSANSAQWAGGTANPQIPVTGINGIKISESGDKVVFEVSGDYYPGNNPSGFITGVDLSDYATTAQVSEKLDTTAFSDVSGTFLTAHQDLSDYQTTAGMTAYQPAGNYLTAVPDTYLQNTDLTITNNKVTEISGIPLDGAGVSGTNVVFVPEYEGANYGYYYSATISGDIVVTTGDYDEYGALISPGTEYSLSSIGGEIGNKLDKSTINDSNTLINYEGHTEVFEKAYRATGFITGSAFDVWINDGDLDVAFDSNEIEPDTHLYSAILTIETTTTGNVPETWNLISYENNSAILTKIFKTNEVTDGVQLWEPDGWHVTNCDASATVYSALEIAPLAFKDDITGITYTTGSI